MPSIYIDGDACPVKNETYKVAGRYGVAVVIVANAPMRVPAGVEMVVRQGFGAADDWIAEAASAGDIAVTADVPLAARCVANGVRVIDHRGRVFTENDIGEALAMRDLMEELRMTGAVGGGPAAMTPRDRSRFLSKLDELVNAVLRG